MLSSQTKDQVVDAAVSKLQTALGGSLSIQGMIDAEEDTIAEAIAKVGFWRRKTGFVYISLSILKQLPPFFCSFFFPHTLFFFFWNAWYTSLSFFVKHRYLKKAALKLRDEFDSDLPKTVDELCSLPGVGPKMAFLTFQIAWNLCVIKEFIYIIIFSHVKKKESWNWRGRSRS